MEFCDPPSPGKRAGRDSRLRLSAEDCLSLDAVCDRTSPEPGLAVLTAKAFYKPFFIQRHRSGRRLRLCGQRLPELNLIPIQVIDPGKATVGFIHSLGVNLYSLLF